MKFIDTDILIDFFRKYQPAIDFLNELSYKKEKVFISSITQMELFVGCKNKGEMKKVTEFLNQYQVIHFSERISAKAIELIKEYNLSHGLLIADAIISATVISFDGELFSKNIGDYQFIKELKVKKPYN
jgi:hypothetical protein